MLVKISKLDGGEDEERKAGGGELRRTEFRLNRDVENRRENRRMPRRLNYEIIKSPGSVIVAHIYRTLSSQLSLS